MLHKCFMSCLHSSSAETMQSNKKPRVFQTYSPAEATTCSTTAKISSGFRTFRAIHATMTLSRRAAAPSANVLGDGAALRAALCSIVDAALVDAPVENADALDFIADAAVDRSHFQAVPVLPLVVIAAVVNTNANAVSAVAGVHGRCTEAVLVSCPSSSMLPL